MKEVSNVLYQSLIAFLVLFIVSKILGKKQVAQLEFSDYVVGISIGSIAAEMSTMNDRPFYHFIIAMVVFGGLDLSITLLARKAHFLKTIFKGRPLILISNGEIIYKNLVKSKLDIKELIALCRDKGYFNLEDIAFCIFENSGKISILPLSSARPTTAEDLNIPNEKVSLPTALVVDGKAVKKELKKLGKDEAWLYKKLEIKTKQQLKDIIIATFDQATCKINVYKKNNNAKFYLC